MVRQTQNGISEQQAVGHDQRTIGPEPLLMEKPIDRRRLPRLVDLSRGSGVLTLPNGQIARTRSRARLQDLLEGRGWTSLRLSIDLIVASLAVIIALFTTEGPAVLSTTHGWLFAFPLVAVGMLHFRGLYRRQVRVMMLDDLAPLAGAVSVASMLLLAWTIFVLGDDQAGPIIGQIWALSILLVGSGRTLLSRYQRRAREQHVVGKPTLIIGAGLVGAQVARRLEEAPEYGLRPVGFLDSNPLASAQAFTGHPPVLGSPDDVAKVAALTKAQHVIFAFTQEPDHGLIPLARRCEELGLEVSLVPRFFESLTDRVCLERLGSLPVFALRAVDPKGWQFEIKYAIDRVVAALLLAILAPLMLVVALAVKASSPGPVIFSQRRVGRDGQFFDLYKFRSMREPETDDVFEARAGLAPGGIEGSDRRTPIGRVLRRFALDELPQVFNVLKGEMSLVGPRPERPEFVDRFGRDLARYTDRHRVKSGITGWAQVSGLRGQTSLHDRIDWDNHYIENWSLWFDVKVMLLTLGAIRRTGNDA